MSHVSLVLASFVSHVSFVALFSEIQVQGVRELLRFFCGQLLLRRQVALVHHEELVDTVRDMLVDLARPILHVVERFLSCDDVMCSRFG